MTCSPTTRSATEIIADLSSRRLGVAELMRVTLDRIAQVNGPLNAVVDLRDADALMAEARIADNAVDRGPLHGLPIAIKDLVNVRGMRTTMGSPIFADQVAQQDDLIAAALRRAGAILIGKTNTPEFGLGSHTFNPVHGATGNPYAPHLSCGGSSGGAAVALATGMLALADGSDMMGSLRNPAGWCNVYGFRPSWGRIPADPIGDTFLHQLATLGPMARDPGDLALMLDVISGTDPRLPYGADCPSVAPLRAADPVGKRIGWLGDWGGAFAMEPGIMAQSRAALDVFSDLGAEVVDLAPPFDADAMWRAWIDLRSWAVAAKLAPLMARKAVLKDSAIWEIERGLALSAMQVHAASVIRSDWFRAAAALFDDFDALVLPTAQVWPFDLNLPWPREVAGATMDTYHRWMQVVVPVSLIGLPALALPAGFGAAGLPAGIQLIGRRGDDAALLALAVAYHEMTRWPQRRPAMDEQNGARI